MPKRRRKNPELVLKEGASRKKISNSTLAKRTKITKLFEMQLFQLWVDGFTLKEIYEMHLHTAQSFSYQTLIWVKKHHNWDERIKDLLNSVKEEQEKHIKLSQKRQLNTLQLVLNMNSNKVQADYLKYMNNPEKYIKEAEKKGVLPAWLCSDINSLTNVVKCYDSIANKDKEIQNNQINNVNNVNNIQLSPEAKHQIWLSLKEAAMNNLKSSPNKTILISEKPEEKNETDNETDIEAEYE